MCIVSDILSESVTAFHLIVITFHNMLFIYIAVVLLPLNGTTGFTVCGWED
jgi:hypothetical protein